MKKIAKKICNVIIFFCIVLFVLMFVFSVFHKVFGFYKTDYVWESKNKFSVLITDDLMNPTIKKGDIAFFKKYKDTTLNEGDIIYFKENNTYKIGIIEKVQKDSLGEFSYKTKGSQNYYYNQNNINSGNINGVYCKSVSHLGLLYKISISNIFSVFIIIVLLVAIIKLQNNKKKSIKRKMKREEFERKK